MDIRPGRRHWGVVLGCSVAGLGFPAGAPVVAQEVELEEIVVTGSRIAVPDFESASPVVTIGSDRFDLTASATIETTLNSMPQFVGSFGSASNNPGSGGMAVASLRGLGGTATLVLVDSRRLVPSDGYGVPDLNLIPPALVERVEVLTGGASAVYGSDALAGVVNLRLLDDYQGAELSGDWSESGSGDAQAYTASVTAGTNFADGRGSVMGFAGYSKRDLLTQGERRFSRVALGYSGPGTNGVGPGGMFLPLGSSNIVEGRVIVTASPEAFDALFAQYGYAAGAVPYQREFGFNTDGTVFTQGNYDDAGSVANFRGAREPLSWNDRRYTYNYAPPNALQLPLERASAFVDGSFEFSEQAEVYAQALYGDYSVNQQLAPTPISRVYFPPSNPYVPPDLKFLLDSRADPSARVQLSKRTLELGPRVSEHDYSTYQATLGLRGDVFRDWQYNAYVQYGQSDQTAYTTGNVSVSRFEALLYSPDGGQAECGGFNPFGYDSISKRCADYLAVELEARTKVSQASAEFTIKGRAYDLPAGAVETVLGIFYKRDEYRLRPDPLQFGLLPDGRPEVSGAMAGQGPVQGDDNNVDFFVEALVPILADRRGVRSLQATLGYRYSDYASFGGASSYKADLLYEPVNPVHFRGSFQHAIRAPSLIQLYNPQLQAFPGIDPPDPCSVGSPQRTGPDAAAVEALCIAQGIPLELMPLFDYQDPEVEGFYGGNPDLEPETANTYTFGIVLTSPFEQALLEDAQISLDWYDIRIDDYIAVLPAGLFIPYCYDRKYNPQLSATNRYCGYFSRDPESGVIVDAYEIPRNVSSFEVSGIDLQLDWRFDAGPGRLGLTWLVTWMDDYLVEVDPKAKPEQWVDTGCCPTLPEWKWNLEGTYSLGGLTLSAVWRYLGRFHDFVETDFDVPATDYVDLTVAYAWDNGLLRGLTLRAGITNAFDEEPKIFPTYEQANTDPTVFDVIGRQYFVSMNYALRPD